MLLPRPNDHAIWISWSILQDSESMTVYREVSLWQSPHCLLPAL